MPKWGIPSLFLIQFSQTDKKCSNFCALGHSSYLKQEVLPSLFLLKSMKILLPVGVNSKFVILNLGSLLAIPGLAVVLVMAFESKLP